VNCTSRHPDQRVLPKAANPGELRSSLLELTDESRDLFARAEMAFDDELQHRLGAALPERTPAAVRVNADPPP
jgi:hypothetical protein